MNEQQARIEEIVGTAKEFEWEVLRRKKLGDVTGIKSARPYVSRMIRALFQEDGDIGKLAVGMYRMNSSVVHVALGSVAEKVAADGPRHGDLYGVPHPTVSDIAGAVSLALMSWGRGNFALVRYCGWDEEEWRQQTHHIGGLIKRLMAVEKGSP